MEIITPIRIDMQRTARPPEIYAKQGDACTHKVQIELCDGGAYWQINTRHAAAIRFCKRDGTGGIYNKLPDGSDAYEFPAVIPTDTIIITLAPEVLTCPGDVLVDVAFSSGVEVLATFNFVVHVQAAPMAGVTASNNYYNYQSLADINKAIDEAKAAAAGAVKSINGSKPDSSGNVNVVAGVAKVNGKAGNVSVAVNAYTTCSTAASTAAKTAELVDGFAPVIGAILAVRFTNNNTAESPRLNYDGIEYIIRDRITAQPIKPGDITAGLYRFMLISGAWILLDKLPSEGTTTPVPGDPGEDGGHWIPHVGDNGTLTWTASKEGMGDAPTPVNIKGLPGADGDPGADGAPGADGQDGGYYIPRIMQPESNIMQIAFDASKSGMTSVQARQIVIPKGDPGQDGAPGPAGDPGPKGDKGDKGDPGSAAIGLGVCNSAANVVNKEISIYTDDFKPIMSAIVTVAFRIENTADNPSLVINNKSYGIIDCRNGQPVKAAAMCGQAHTYVLDPQNSVAFLLDPNTATSSVTLDKTLTQEGQAADAKAVGDKIKEVRDNFTSGNEQLAGTDLTLQDPADADHGVALQLGAKIVDSSGFPTAQRLYPTGIYGDEPVIIGNLADPQDPRDAVSRQYLDDRLGALPASGTAVWRLLGEYDFANEQVGVIELTNLGGLTDIYFRWEGISNTSATKSGMIITVNSVVAALGEGDIIPIQSSSQSKLYGYTSAHWNGLSWDARTTGGAVSPENYSANAYWRGQYNQKLNVGACNEIKISQPGLDYKATSGILRIYGGK